MQVNVQQGRLRGVDAAAQRRLDEVDIVEPLGSMQIDDQMHASATNAVADGEVACAAFACRRLDHGNVRDSSSGGTWTPQALPRSQEGVLAHRRPPQPSDPTRVPTSGATARECRSTIPYEGQITAAGPHIRRAPRESRRFCTASVYTILSANRFSNRPTESAVMHGPALHSQTRWVVENCSAGGSAVLLVTVARRSS